MRKLASLVEIASCDPIPDTERLSVATMKGKGWRVVTGRGEFAPGLRTWDVRRRTLVALGVPVRRAKVLRPTSYVLKELTSYVLCPRKTRN